MDEDIIKMVQDHERRIAALENKKVEAAPERFRGQSINEYLLETKASGYIKKTVACGYYLEKEKSTEFFTLGDIEATLREAREPVSKNTSKDIQRGMKKGWIMQHTEKKAGKRTYRITAKGIKAIESKFEGKGDKNEG